MLDCPKTDIHTWVFFFYAFMTNMELSWLILIIGKQGNSKTILVTYIYLQ